MESSPRKVGAEVPTIDWRGLGDSKKPGFARSVKSGEQMPLVTRRETTNGWKHRSRENAPESSPAGCMTKALLRSLRNRVLDSADPSVTNATGQAPLIAFPIGGVAGDVPVVGKWCYTTPPNIMACPSGS